MKGGIGELSGLKEARETLQALDRRVQTKVGKRVLKAPARVFVRHIKAKARVSSRGSNPTKGSLRESVREGKASSRKGQARQEIIVDDIAAVPNEFGTSKMPAQPLVRPGINAGREEAAQACATAVKIEVDAEVASIAKKGR